VDISSSSFLKETFLMAHLARPELRGMTNRMLSHLLYKDLSNGQHYRDEIARRVTIGDPEAVWIWANIDLNYTPRIQTPSSQPVNGKSPPDIRDAVGRVMDNLQPISPLMTTMLNSGWDYSDPQNLMQWTPDKVIDFLKTLEWQPRQYYDDLSEKRRTTLIMIIDAYGRWYRKQIDQAVMRS
jgi:hypothetical protein